MAGYDARGIRQFSRQVGDVLAREAPFTWVTLAPKFWVSCSGLLGRFKHLLRFSELYMITCPWIAIASPNPSCPSRNHLHALLDEVADMGVLRKLAHRSSVAGDSRWAVDVRRAVPSHAGYLVKHLGDGRAEIEPSRAFVALLKGPPIRWPIDRKWRESL